MAGNILIGAWIPLFYFAKFSIFFPAKSFRKVKSRKSRVEHEVGPTVASRDHKV